jgi:hypothetical protein
MLQIREQSPAPASNWTTTPQPSSPQPSHYTEWAT